MESTFPGILIKKNNYESSRFKTFDKSFLEFLLVDKLFPFLEDSKSTILDSRLFNFLLIVSSLDSKSSSKILMEVENSLIWSLIKS